MTDDQFRILTRDLNGATLTNTQAKQLKELVNLAVLRGAQPAVLKTREPATPKAGPTSVHSLTKF